MLGYALCPSCLLDARTRGRLGNRRRRGQVEKQAGRRGRFAIEVAVERLGDPARLSLIEIRPDLWALLEWFPKTLAIVKARRLAAQQARALAARGAGAT